MAALLCKFRWDTCPKHSARLGRQCTSTFNMKRKASGSCLVLPWNIFNKDHFICKSYCGKVVAFTSTLLPSVFPINRRDYSVPQSLFLPQAKNWARNVLKTIKVKSSFAADPKFRICAEMWMCHFPSGVLTFWCTFGLKVVVVELLKQSLSQTSLLSWGAGTLSWNFLKILRVMNKKVKWKTQICEEHWSDWLFSRHGKILDLN